MKQAFVRVFALHLLSIFSKSPVKVGSFYLSHQNICRKSRGSALPRYCTTADAAIPDEITEEDYNLGVKLALGEDHVQELSAKMEAAKNEEWDILASFS